MWAVQAIVIASIHLHGEGGAGGSRPFPRQRSGSIDVMVAEGALHAAALG